jgi:hypothetical protein
MSADVHGREPLAGEEWPPRQRRAALLLAQGMTPTTATAELVNRQLVALEAAAHDQLRAALPVAIAGLVELAQQREMPAVWLGACNAITRVWAKHVEEVEVRQELDDLQTRLAELVELTREQQPGWLPANPLIPALTGRWAVCAPSQRTIAAARIQSLTGFAPTQPPGWPHKWRQGLRSARRSACPGVCGSPFTYASGFPACSGEAGRFALHPCPPD